MSESKTKPTAVPVETYLNAIQDEFRRADCRTLVALMKRVTGCPPKMWGPGIVGFDAYHYRYASGREGDACVVGFSSGRSHLTVYLVEGFEAASTRALLARLGKHKTGTACLYMKRLADVDPAVLEQLVAESVAGTRRRYPPAAS